VFYETRVIHPRGADTAADLLEQTCQERAAKTARPERGTVAGCLVVALAIPSETTN
jgi:hypothetical protein